MSSQSEDSTASSPISSEESADSSFSGFDRRLAPNRNPSRVAVPVAEVHLSHSPSDEENASRSSSFSFSAYYEALSDSDGEVSTVSPYYVPSRQQVQSEKEDTMESNCEKTEHHLKELESSIQPHDKSTRHSFLRLKRYWRKVKGDVHKLNDRLADADVEITRLKADTRDAEKEAAQSLRKLGKATREIDEMKIAMTEAEEQAAKSERKLGKAIREIDEMKMAMTEAEEQAAKSDRALRHEIKILWKDSKKQKQDSDIVRSVNRRKRKFVSFRGSAGTDFPNSPHQKADQR